MTPRASRVTGIVVAALLTLGLLVGLPGGTALAATATATFAKTSDWGTGFVANYTIANTGTTAISGWSLAFDLSATQHVTDAWNAVLSSSGNHDVLSNESWDQTIAPGAQVTVGFEGTYSGTWTDPSNCTLNGASCAGGGTGTSTTTSSTLVTTTTQPPGQGGGSFASAPYYMPNDNDPPDLAQVAAASGQTHYVFAFVLASGSACQPAWDGTVPLAQDSAIKAKIDGARALGGDVVVAFGGALGTKLAQVCADATATAAAMQQVIARYSLKAIDLDIEEPEIENDQAVNNELGAAKLLKQNNPGLTVFVTLPTLQTGVNFFGSGVIQKARDQAVPIDSFTIMPFDMGGDNAMGDNAVSTAEAFHAQLMSLFPGITSAQAYRLLGLSLMNGRTDVGEFYRQTDFQTVLSYAQSHHIGRLSYWAVNRDRQCTPPEGGPTSGTCSSVTQAPWEFTKLLAPFNG